MTTARDTPTIHRRYFILHAILYFSFLSLSKRSHCFSTSCSFSPTHPPCFCISSRQGRLQRGLFLLIFSDLYFVSSDVEMNFSLGQKQTVLLMCCWRGQLFLFGRYRSKGLIDNRTRHTHYSWALIYIACYIVFQFLITLEEVTLFLYLV